MRTESSRSAVLGEGLARCLISQGHLLPLPGHICPIYWAWDHALQLNPLPDLLVVVEPDAVAQIPEFASVGNRLTSSPEWAAGCCLVNPGRFGRRLVKSHRPDIAVDVETDDDRTNSASVEYSFKVFYPYSGLVENSRLPD
ncbi:unnamed protein product [Protopolystoma xenopodis]|uniref:Uncharacterized protein n=1 Tax=Protopolystoma xenopodis TaxID=117903 RepID=A0A448WLD2_9PLAT|nr:unnamed protein product [Protopolystoma xenopodis]